jgi:hypothetical protein
MHWKGYSGLIGGTGGALGLDGALRLHWWHPAQRMFMSGVIPGQNTDVSARAIMDVTPW